LTALNGLTAQVQNFATGTTGTDFAISSATSTHTFNLPTASAANRGALSSADWSAFNGKFNLPALTSGSVLFSNGTTIAQDNANFFWDDTNNRLGIGTATPIAPLVVQSNSGALGISIRQRTGNDFANLLFTNLSDTTLGGVGYVSTSRMRFMTGGLGDSFERLSVFQSTGNVAIGTTTDAGYKLDVNGSGRILNGSAQLLVNNATYSELAYGTTNYFRANGGSAIVNGPIIQFLRSGNEVARFATTTGNFLINTTTDVASSILTLASTTKGFLPPRMTTTQKNAIATPAAGLVVYDTTLNKLCVYTTAWETITSI
jgi:hypothetical protein